MSKLSFRARALDASKPMPIYMAEELPDLPDYSAINRAVPQMPSGMEKEEECEHHLQRAICAGLIIPTPEVTDMPDREFYDKAYPANYKQPRQLIHMQPFSMEQDIPDYDMDSEDEKWVESQEGKLNLDLLKFEEMMDTLEKSSGQQVVTEEDARSLLKHTAGGDMTIAIFDYWLTKRLERQKPLIPVVKTEQRAGTAANNPYLAFRRRTEKMQTRKNRKNDETSYEKMLKLRRDLNRAVTLLDLVKKREKMKREHVDLTVEIFEKRYHARDFSGAIYAEASVIRASRPAFTPIFHNHYTNQNWANKAILKEDVIPRKEKRQYKKRKHKSLTHSRSVGTSGMDYAAYSSDEESPVTSQFSPEPEETEDEGQFAFRRNKMCSYHRPLSVVGNWAWCSKEENGHADKRFRFTLTSLSHPKRRCIGFARRRVGRGGRIILDRMSTDNDDLWRHLDFTILEPNRRFECVTGNTFPSDGGSSSVTRPNSSSFNLSNTNSNLRTEIKSEFSSNFNDNGNSASRTNVNDISDFSVKIKQEVEEETSRVGGEAAMDIDESINPIDAEQENGEILEILRSVQRDWLHFRPKTPPPDYESPCHMLPLSDSYIVPSANPSSFSVELQSLDPPSTLLDTSSFLTDPFSFETIDCLDVPVTDTRQPSSSDKIVQTGINLNVNVGLNTLTPCSVDDSSVFSSANSSSNPCDRAKSEEEAGTQSGELILCSDDPLNRTVMPGCSRFHVTDLDDSSAGVMQDSCTHKTLFSSTLASPKFNSVNAVSGSRPHSNTSTSATTMQQSTSTSSDGSLSNTNGLWSQFGYDGKMKNNKLPYAYSGGVGYSNASSGTLSLHTSAHTLTLNSHSANILEIPITDDPEPVSNKLGNTQCAETGTTTTNNKPKTICRKNNLVMEVT